MSKAKFSSEQQQLLRNNPYTVRVTEDFLYLSKEFKELFYKEHLAGAVPRDILEKYGYPSDVLGKERIWGISYTIRKQFEKTGEFRDVRTPNSSVTANSPEEKIRQLELQVNYLTPEVEFVPSMKTVFPEISPRSKRCDVTSERRSLEQAER